MQPEVARQATEALQRLTWKHVLAGFAVMILFFVVAKLGSFLLRRSLSRGPHWGGPIFALSKLLSYFLVFIGVVSGLTVMGVNLSTLMLTSSALLIGLGFSLQHVARDFIAGVILLVEQPIRKNDFVTFAKTEGTVNEIGLRATHLRTPDGVQLIVPNHLLVTTELSNHTHPLKRSRLRVSVPVSTSADLDLVEETLAHVADGHPDVLAHPPPIVWCEAIETSHFQLALIVWVLEPPKTLRVASDLRFAIARAFVRRGIPFPLPELLLHEHPPADH
jgi:small-conductance mechanosensitive channel